MNNRLTIITINYNNYDGLLKTFKSIRMQSCRDFEYVVVDGGSADKSVELIKTNEDIIDHWISEADNGIYNAMNKGARMATGEYLTYLNSGDSLYDPQVVYDFLEFINHEGGADIVIGQCFNYSKSAESVFKIKTPLTLMSLHYDVVNHSGTFIKRDLQLRHLYREDLRICSDRQFFIEAIVIDNCSYCIMERIITKFDCCGISSSKKNNKLMEKENEEILKSLFPPRIVEDYKMTNLLLSELTKDMVKYYGLAKIMIKVNKVFLKLYSKITH